MAEWYLYAESYIYIYLKYINFNFNSNRLHGFIIFRFVPFYWRIGSWGIVMFLSFEQLRKLAAYASQWEFSGIDHSPYDSSLSKIKAFLMLNANTRTVSPSSQVSIRTWSPWSLKFNLSYEWSLIIMTFCYILLRYCLQNFV